MVVLVFCVVVTVKFQASYVKAEAGLLAVLYKSGLVLHIFSSLLYSRLLK